MIYSEKYNFVYLHNPRTGGKSIQSVLIQLDPDCMHTIGKSEKSEHRGSDFIKVLLGDYKWNNAFKFCFVRNPYSWFLSSFHRDLSWEQPKKEYSILVRDDKQLPIPIDGIVKKTHVVLYESLRQFHWGKRIDGIKRDDHFFDCHEGQGVWATDDMNFIGRFESLQSDFNYICDKIGIESIVLPHLNEDEWAQRSFINLKYSESAKKLIGILYEEDIVNFGYEYEE